MWTCQARGGEKRKEMGGYVSVGVYVLARACVLDCTGTLACGRTTDVGGDGT
jgi:hypothetical protein